MARIRITRRVRVTPTRTTRTTRTIRYKKCPYCGAACQWRPAGVRVTCYHCGLVFVM